MTDVDEVMKQTKKQLSKGVSYVKGTARAITKDPYSTDADNTRSKQQKRMMKAGRRRNFANKIDTIDPHYGRKAAAVLAGGTALGLAATTCPGVGAALGPAVGGVVIAAGLAKLEHDAHKAVGDHATLDTLLDDTSDDWKTNHPQPAEGEYEQDRQEWLDEVLGYEDDDDDDEYYDYELESPARGTASATSPAQPVTLESVPDPSSVTSTAPAPAKPAAPQGDLLSLDFLDTPATPTAATPAAAPAVPDDDPFAALAVRHSEAEAAGGGAFDFFAQEAPTAPAAAEPPSLLSDTSLFPGTISLTPTPAQPPPASRYDAFKL